MSQINLFRGGIHPADKKSLTESEKIQTLPLPDKVYIPLRQHIGAEATPIVAPNDMVKKGQLIAEIKGMISANIHASISGKVVAIAEYPHPVFGTCKAIEIESDDKDEWAEGLPMKRNWMGLSADDLIEIITSAGIVGLGGATFPTHVKLSPPPEKKIDTLILNAAECEPYLTSDYRVLLEYTNEVITGTRIVMKALGVENAIVGIEDNKKDAAETLNTAIDGRDISVKVLPTKYPQGAEKMLIKALTGRIVPSGKLPADIGAVVLNVSTVKAIYDAVVYAIPLIERVATISGGALNEPQNALIRVGTPFKDIIEMAGGYLVEPAKVILGGPMMGIAQYSTDVPAIKGTGGILALTKNEVKTFDETNCIRCGTCVEACPMGLVPSMLSILGERKMFEEARDEYNLLDCMECGSCVYVCPAKRHIVQYVRSSKSMLTIKSRYYNNN